MRLTHSHIQGIYTQATHAGARSRIFPAVESSHPPFQLVLCCTFVNTFPFHQFPVVFQQGILFNQFTFNSQTEDVLLMTTGFEQFEPLHNCVDVDLNTKRGSFFVCIQSLSRED